ncbi:exportin-2-like [Nymphaea colorata]|uniref:Importin N-terminal domain-containing protein n=1 Tax=Nymphaea colorata TaxID=210225 RepID=A0A5K0VF69_9MAGN|nr:exportin-2-like [Nymphaea colorata]XP_031505827.1 exportin-2-like [Nymphaea colorata]
MDASPETLEILTRCFLQTFSPDRQPRRQAEEYLASAAERPGYALAVLRLLCSASAPDQARLAASVAFKNHLRSRWSPSPDLATSAIADAEKEQIRTLTVRIMLSSQPSIQGQLSKSLAVIGEYDFPKAWPGLLPELVASVRSGAASLDYSAVNGALATTHSIFKKFRTKHYTNDLLLDLKYCVDGFAAPLLELFLQTGRLIDAAVAGGGGGDALLFRRWFESQLFCCRIFFSLNSHELPQFFEDHMKEWMGEFQKYLTTAYPLLDNDESGGGREVADKLRKAVCTNINLYMNNNEEKFRPFLSGFASAVGSLLVSVSAMPNRDRLTVAAIKFLTTISTSVDHSLFASPDTLRLICQSIVIPNVRVREDDEESFEMDYVEYIRRDIEGSDVDTRRRIACDLVRGLLRKYREQVRALLSAEMQSMMEKYAANPTENWKDKDCAIFLVVYFSHPRNELVDVWSFFKAVIDPELKCADVNSQPMLKADALKFLTTFRSRIPKNLALELVPHAVRFLTAESNVVHSYAANCIEKLLLVKDDGRERYTASDISPFLIPLMTNLYHVFELPGSEENQYAMKCIWRVFLVAEFNADFAAACIAGLKTRVYEVCKNSKNPTFNRYLFESIVELVRRTCEKDPSLIKTLEPSLFDMLQKILVEDIIEFLPYALQIFGQAMDMNRPPLPATYMQLFDALLSPGLWLREENVPALVRLLQAYLEKAPMELKQRLSEVLGIFQTLIGSALTDESGFYVVNTVIENLSYDVMSPYVLHIWNALFTRLHKQRTTRFIKSLLVFMSLFLVKHGHSTLVNTINAVQENLFGVILEQLWIPHLKLITGSVEVKLCLVASTGLLCESSSLLQDSPPVLILWGKLLDSIVTLLSRSEQERVDDEPGVSDICEAVGYTAIWKKKEDPVEAIKDPKEYVITSLARLSTLSPGKYPAIIQGSLDSANQAALLQLCGMYNCSIV